jgi:hypothetical protein
MCAALRRGFDTLSRYPALFLLPLLWDVVQLGLHYWGVPAAPVSPSLTFGPQPAPAALRGFLPSAVPSLADLNLQVAPALQTAPGLAATGMLLTSYILVPLVGALVAALFLGLLGDALIGRELSWRRALSHWPTFAVLSLAGRLLPLILPEGLIVPLMVIGAILFGLLPYAVGVLGLPLMDALRAAPALLWGRIGTWIGLGLVTMLITFAATGVWQLCNRSPLVALVFYPALGTALVAAAAALCLDPEETTSRTPHPLWMLPLVLLTVGGAWLGAGWIDAWAGWQPSREAALARDAQPPFMFGSERHTCSG